MKEIICRAVVAAGVSIIVISVISFIKKQCNKINKKIMSRTPLTVREKLK